MGTNQPFEGFSKSEVHGAMGVGAIGGMGVASAAMGYMGSIAQAESFKAQAGQADTSAKLAGLQGKYDALNLGINYNRTQSANVITSVAQGRRGGSVDAVNDASANQYNWDLAYSELSTDIAVMGYEEQGRQFREAARATTQSAGMNAILGGVTTGASLFAIGG